MLANGILKATTGPRSAQITAASSLIASIGIILLIPQGLVALVFSFVAPDIRLWFAPMYLPEQLRVPSSLILALVGALLLATTRDIWRSSAVREG